MFGWVIVSRQLHFHIYYLFVGPIRTLENMVRSSRRTISMVIWRTRSKIHNPIPLHHFRISIPEKILMDEVAIVLFIVTIIISPPQSSAGHSPLLLFAISLDLQLLASSSCHPYCANRHSTRPEGVLHYVYRDAVSIPELVYPSGCRFYGWYGQPTATSAY
jgi:hypothetical protein